MMMMKKKRLATFTQLALFISIACFINNNSFFFDKNIPLTIKTNICCLVYLYLVVLIA